MEGSSHSYHLALHCFADLRFKREATLAHWFLPYFMTAAFKISSSVFFHTPPLIIIRILVFVDGARGRPVQRWSLGARRRGAAGGSTSAWGGAAVVRCLAGEAGAPPRYRSAGRRGELLRRAPALRGWKRCARLSASSEVRCVAFTAPSRLLCLLVCLHDARNDCLSFAFF